MGLGGRKEGARRLASPVLVVPGVEGGNVSSALSVSALDPLLLARVTPRLRQVAIKPARGSATKRGDALDWLCHSATSLPSKYSTPERPLSMG